MTLAYTEIADVQARLPGRTIDATSKPSTTQVTLWLTEAEAAMVGALNGAGISVPDSSEILTAWCTDYAEGHCRMSWVATALDENNDGQDLVTKFWERIDKIREDPSFYDGMLNGTASSASSRVRAYVISNDDDLSISDGDFDPLFERDEEW